MLKSIYIDNYALIEKLSIEFREGLSIITGETGAGKTILLGALGLLLGKRADISVLKNKDQKCIVEGVFGLSNHGLEEFFKEQELDYATDTIIRREVASSGKSRAFINDTPVNLEVVQELSLRLIDIHSQHQNLALNSENYLLWIIDAFAGNELPVRKVRQLYHEWREAEKKYLFLKGSYQNDKQNYDYLTHQYNELHSAGLIPGELAELEEKASVINHAELIKSGLEQSMILMGNEQTGAITSMKQVTDLLDKVRKHFQPSEELRKRIEGIYIDLKDIYAETEQYFNKIDFNAGEAEKINERISTINSLMFKHKAGTVEELVALRDELDAKIRQISVSDEEMEKLKKEVESREAEFRKNAGELSSRRKSVLRKFEDELLGLIHQLGMKNAVFSVIVEPAEPSASGTDRIHFLFSANRNLPPQNISKVASGGELSRLMLAIKRLISGTAGLPTIIFDEIDSGVSGEIADKVGRLILEMASGMQVINITHLPQVASKGHYHFMVYKQQSNGTTRTMIRELSDDERVLELARMLSGDSVTDAAIANAKVLLGR